MKAFKPQMMQVVSTSTGTQELIIDLKNSPFYLRMKFTKSIIPPGGEDYANARLADINQGLPALVKHIDQLAHLGDLPYYAKVEKNDRTAFIDMAKSMYEWYSAQGHNERLAKYWYGVLQNASSNQKQWNAPWKVLEKVGYANSVRVPIDEIYSIRDKIQLLRALYYAENAPTSEGVYKVNMAALIEKLKKEYANKAHTKDEYSIFQNKSPEKVQEVYQSLAVPTIEKLTAIFSKPYAMRTKEEIDSLTQTDLRYALLSMYNVKTSQPLSELRYHAKPRAYPNGLDQQYIYPPMVYKDGAYQLDHDNGNLGYKEIKNRLYDLYHLFLTQGNNIETIYEQIEAEHPDHPIMKNHTSGDNVAMMIQKIKNMSTEQFQELLKSKAPKGTKKDEAVMSYGNSMKNMIEKYGFQYAKLMDLINYEMIKAFPDDRLGVHGSNRSNAGISGEIMIAVQYAYNARLEDIAHYDEENKQILDSVINKQIAQYEMIRKSIKAPHIHDPNVQLPTSGKKITPKIEGKVAKLIPQLRYIVGQKSSKTGPMRGSTYKVHQETGKNIYEPLYQTTTFEAAISKLENLYPQVFDMLADDIEILKLRLDVAEMKIKEAIQEAIDIKNAQAGGEIITLTDATGMPVMEQEQQIVEKEIAISDAMPEYSESSETVEETSVEDAKQELQQQQIPEAPVFQEQVNDDLAQEIIDAIAPYAENPWMIYEFPAKTVELLWKQHFESPQQFVAALEQLKGNPAQQNPTDNPNPQDKLSSKTLETLIRVADSMDKKGKSDLANKIDLFIAKVAKLGNQ